MINNLWKYFFKKAGCTPESIWEVEKLLNARVNRIN